MLLCREERVMMSAVVSGQKAFSFFVPSLERFSQSYTNLLS